MDTKSCGGGVCQVKMVVGKAHFLVESKNACLQVGKDAVGKGSHEISRVVWDDSLEGRNGTLHLALGRKSNDSKHGGTAIVNLLDKTGCLLLLGIILAQAKRIVQVQCASRNDFGVECRERSDLSSLHVVGLTGALTPVFEESNEAKDLVLSGVGNGIPGVGRGETLWEGSAVHGHGPGEGDSVGVGNVADEGKHGNPSMLDLGFAEESNGGLIGLAPEFSLGQSKGIVKSQNGVQLFGQDL
mmetsp:Transcript_27920/g.50798  ORF Transcript_27920/g.50798 Transcript_27920/m.50798 type:complete len:242 (-) Transcript_27920:159-884(-)